MKKKTRINPKAKTHTKSKSSPRAKSNKKAYTNQNNIIIGKLDINRQGYGFVMPDNKEFDDILIKQNKLLGAINNDIVEAKITNTNGKKLEGEIISIIKRSTILFKGIIHVKKDFGFVIPDERYKMLQDIYVPASKLLNAKDGDTVYAKIVDWNEKGKNPVGKVTEILTGQSLKEVMWKTILIDNGFELEFTETVLKEANALTAEINSDTLKHRLDYRNILTFTIDPADAKDFDDAISYQKLENGNIEIGVHIADVSHFVTQNSALDKHAADACTSVYLVDGTLPMLPENISNGLCSLRPKEDKFAFAAIFELDENANIKKERFSKTLINSDRRYSYEEAQEILESKTGDFATELAHINALAYKLRDRKFKEGAINFDTVETKFKLDENGKPLEIILKERKDAHLLIEDFMLLANRQVAAFVAKQIYKGKHIPIPYRIHDLPDLEKLKQFNNFAKQFGYRINITSPKQIAISFNKMSADLKGKPEENILTSLGIRCMAKAAYSTENIGHYGLGFAYYCHFTSPIRRYPDVLTHRILYEFLQNKDITYDAQTIEMLCKQSNYKEKMATTAERDSIKYKQAEFLTTQIGKQFKGVISGVTSFGIFVEMIENKCEGKVSIRNMNEPFNFDEKNLVLTGKYSGTQYTLGQEVMVTIANANAEKMEIDLTINEL